MNIEADLEDVMRVPYLVTMQAKVGSNWTLFADGVM